MLPECKFGSKTGGPNGGSESHRARQDPTSDLVKELAKMSRIYTYSLCWLFQCILTPISWVLLHPRHRASCRSRRCPFHLEAKITSNRSPPPLMIAMELRPGTTSILYSILSHPAPTQPLLPYNPFCHTETGNNRPLQLKFKAIGLAESQA